MRRAFAVLFVLLVTLVPGVRAGDEIPDQVVVINTQQAIDVPYAFGEIGRAHV